ncbi:ArsR/SmtB family transcription factor [Achromobacter aloeverae]|uniref:Transcriptional regulator n=1 Tax=Achromobacter aloeverae TaxID=1750518 RepID=A0A4Q1HN93_9BURK|nr:helix-turn-helix transcriptional regulator [Achromobacter aloeverae]RXN92482.1 transcriptional regulator [Achromobacter aloeverae]
MDTEPDIARVAHLIADPARAAMLMLLTDGRARPAGELAYAAAVTPQTASSHLGKLLGGRLLAVETEGRHRYYRLAGPHVAVALEHLAAIIPVTTVRRKPLGRDAQALQFARCCYDHLAGSVGVAVTQALLARGCLVAAQGKRLDVTPAGAAWFADMGLDVTAIAPTPRGLARACLDWTERQHHLAGPLGVRFTALLCEKGWLRRHRDSRAVQVTPLGWTGLRDALGIAPGLGLDGAGTAAGPGRQPA